MAWTASLDVSVGNATKETDYDQLVANAEYLQTLADVEHNFNVSSGTGYHKAMTVAGTLVVGVDDAGYDVTLHGDTAGKSMLWDTSADKLLITGDIEVTGTATGFGSGTVLSGNTNNTICTVTGADAIVGEANLTFDGSVLNVIGTAGVGTIVATDGTFHVQAATAGVVAAGAEGNTAVFEASGNHGISLLCPDANTNNINWGSPSSAAYITTSAGYNSGTPYLNLTASRAMVNETLNANMTTGLTINQSGSDNEIFALKSSDVAHGMTNLAETDTYGTITKSGGTSGGLMITGYKDANGDSGKAIQMSAFLGKTADTRKQTASAGVFNLDAGIKSGTGSTAVGADGNLWNLRNSSTTRFILDAEGSGHSDVEWTTYGVHDDLALISDMEATLLAIEHPSQTPRRHAMEATGIIGKDSWHMENGKPRAMVNFTKLAMLHHGAHIQTAERMNFYEDRIVQLEAQVKNLLEN